MYKDYEIKLNAILDKHKGVQKVELESLKKIKAFVEGWKTFNKDQDRVLKESKKLLDKLESAGSNFKSVYGELKDYIKEYDQYYTETRKVMNDFYQAGQKIGIDVSKTDEYKQLNKLSDSTGKNIAIELERIEISLFNYKDNF